MNNKNGMALMILGIWLSVGYAVANGAPYEVYCIAGLATFVVVFFGA